MRPLFLLLLALPALAVAKPPAESVHVESPTVPGLVLAIDRRFHALPPLTFPIETMTDAERRIFFEADEKRMIQRMIVVQYEKVQAASDFRFRYPSRPPQRFGSETYRFGTYVNDDQASATAAPDKEAALTRAFLRTHGLASPRTYRIARLARVTDPKGLTEVIIFYMENADSDFAPGPLPGADQDGDVPIEGAEQAALFGRLQQAIKVISG